MSKKIYLSPSNQYSNTYATGNTNEMAQCDKIASATATALKRCGFEVKVGKSGDSMQNRCNESDNFKADIHMPIHTNACNGKITGGTRIFVLDSARKNAGQAVLNALGPISPGTADSLTYKTDLYEINVPNALTIYVEVEFHDTKTGSDWICNNTTNIGEAICKGLCSYFGVTYKSGAKVLDSQGYKKGQTSDGVLAIKELLLLAKTLKIHNQGVDENGAFGDGTEKAVNGLLKKWDYDQNGIAGDNFIKKLTAEIKKKI
ncbi:N-acetylmuramoyl-L-alanine amidase [uncultured Ruminococcus sp.]|uniref:N-acetylmuramoyl-L-alanine amidase n=1 Tax=uncultured Ruminococcus sp. TaxID=165186 RepID=UPI0025F59611|nr:N-acetylmuramoyl-L-alanine amidase [uncultured Ruminococcus sp.]